MRGCPAPVQFLATQYPVRPGAREAMAAGDTPQVPDEVIEELKLTKTSERAGRAQDHVGRNSMQELRAKGFM